MNRITNALIIRYRSAALSLLLAGAAIFAPQLAIACSCAAFPDNEARAAAIAYARADVIFLGAVSKIQLRRLSLSRTLSFMAVRDTSFDVLQVWKGLTGFNPAVVRSAKGETACGFRFRKPGKYLVFAYWDSDRQVLTTSMCELTRTASEATGLIRELDKITHKNGSPGEEKPP